MILVIIGTILHGIFLIPRKYSNSALNFYYLILTGSGLLISLLIYYFYAPSLIVFSDNFKLLLLGLLLGIIWAVASYSYIWGTDIIGLSRSTSLKNLTAIIGLSFGIWFFKEYADANSFQLITVVAGCLMMFVSSTVLAQTLPTGAGQKTKNIRGIINSLVAAIFFAVYAAGVKFVSPGFPNGYLIPVLTAAGGFLTALTVMIIYNSSLKRKTWLKEPLKEYILAFISGTLWVIGTFCVTFGINLSGVGISWSLIPLSTLVSVIVGVWGFKEIDPSRYRWKLISGITGSGGALILLLASKLFA